MENGEFDAFVEQFTAAARDRNTDVAGLLQQLLDTVQPQGAGADDNDKPSLDDLPEATEFLEALRACPAGTEKHVIRSLCPCMAEELLPIGTGSALYAEASKYPNFKAIWSARTACLKREQHVLQAVIQLAATVKAQGEVPSQVDYEIFAAGQMAYSAVVRNQRELTLLMLNTTKAPQHIIQQIVPPRVARNSLISVEHDRLLEEWRRSNQGPDARNCGSRRGHGNNRRRGGRSSSNHNANQ